MNNQTLADHIKNEHNTSPFSTYVKEFVYGGNDGIVTTFAVVAGFSGANIGEHSLNFSILTVLLFGLANLFADGAAMGLGNYLSIRSEQKLYRNYYNKELEETKTSRDYEIEETELLFENQGFSKEDAHSLTKIVSKIATFGSNSWCNMSAIWTTLKVIVPFIVDWPHFRHLYFLDLFL